MPKRKLKSTIRRQPTCDATPEINELLKTQSSSTPVKPFNSAVVTMSEEDGAPAAAAILSSAEMDFINVPPPSFSGRSSDDAFAFVKEFERYVEWKNVTSDDRKRALFAVLLRDNAGTWYDTTSDSDRSSYATLRAAFDKRYLSTDAVKHRSARDLFTKKQAESETVDDFVTSVRRLAQLINAKDDVIKWVLLCGLKPQISAVVTQHKADTVDEILDVARLAELTTAPSTTTDNTIMLDQIAQLQSEVRRLGRDRVTAIGPSRSPTPERRRVSFDQSYNQRSLVPDGRQYNTSPLPSGKQGQLRASSSNNWPLKSGHQFTEQSVCYRCARPNCVGQRGMCAGYGKQCFSCGKFNHVARACRAAQGTPSFQPHFQY
jgi:hypothetical protein